MKKAIRLNLWESNSSISHALIILPKKKYEGWKHGGLYLYTGDVKWSMFEHLLDPPKYEKLYTYNEVVDFLRKVDRYPDKEDYDKYDFQDAVDDAIREAEFFKFDEWPCDLYEDEYNYTSESGDEIVIRARYGYD